MAERAPATVAEAVREFLERAGAARVAVLLDRGTEQPSLMIDALEDGSLEIEGGGGEDPTVAVPDIRPIPPLSVTRTSEGVDLPLVPLAYLAGHVRAFAAALGGRSVATVHFHTTDAELPLAIAAREGEPLLVLVGEETFPLPDGWPE